MSHSSGARPAGKACGLAGTTTMRACCRSMVAVQPTWPLSWMMVEAMYDTCGAFGARLRDNKTANAMTQAAATALVPSASQRQNERLSPRRRDDVSAKWDRVSAKLSEARIRVHM